MPPGRNAPSPSSSNERRVLSKNDLVWDGGSTNAQNIRIPNAKMPQRGNAGVRKYKKVKCQSERKRESRERRNNREREKAGKERCSMQEGERKGKGQRARGQGGGVGARGQGAQGSKKGPVQSVPNPSVSHNAMSAPAPFSK